jgi:hypothetical protein
LYGVFVWARRALSRPKRRFSARAVFGWKISNSVQTAVSVNIIAGTAINICISWSGDYWREREGGRQICLGPSLTLRQGTKKKCTIIPGGLSGIIGWICPFTFVFFSYWSPPAFPHGVLYTVVIFWTVYGNLFGGMAGPGR